MIFPSVLLRMRNVSDKSYGENRNTHFMFSNFLKKILPFYEIMWKKCTAGQTTDYNMRIRIAWWIPRYTLRICNTYCFSTVTMVARTHTNVTLYLHCPSCLYLISIFRQEEGGHLFLPDVKTTLKDNVSY